MSAPKPNLDTLFHSALDIVSSEERAAFISQACGDDAVLRSEVERLVASHQMAGSFLEKPALEYLEKPVDDSKRLEKVADSSSLQDGFEPTLRYDDPDILTDSDRNAPAIVGKLIDGKYRLVERIGEGGMGSVWRAKQSEPVNRFVALKLIKAGMDSKRVLARFEAERQALALMDHTNIAKIFDGGLHEQRPYFVMELVKGVPITQYCDENRLPPAKRLELFIQVCLAIQHAHQKGIIHRDIKPNNVLIAHYDDQAVVKVIDFGVAKATGAILSESTIDTDFGGIVGTPQYMSPEQATFNNLDIDTRSDIYALGILLYELLAGSPPFTGKELQKKGLLEMLRVVREEEPPRPSTKLSSDEALPSLAARRGTEPSKLPGLLRSDLDWIVMKALEKDRARRYETANGFAADLLRYLAGEAVLAHPPSRVYRLRKFLRKHRSQVIAASLLLLSLLAGIVGTSLGLLEARQNARIALDQTQKKEAARAEAERQRGIAQANEQLAEKRLAEVEAEKKKVETEKLRTDQETRVTRAVNDFLRNKLLAQADTTFQANALLDTGRAAGESKFNPTIRELLDRAANELTPDKIETNFPNQPLVQAQILRTVGNAYRGIGEDQTGILFLTRSMSLFRNHLGPDDYLTLATMNDLATGYYFIDQFDKAVPLFKETVGLMNAALGPDHPETLIPRGTLACCYMQMGQPDTALPLFQELMTLAKAQFGSDHTVTIGVMNHLATCYDRVGRGNQALSLFEESLALAKTKFGSDHPSALVILANLANCYQNLNQPEKSLPYLEEALRLTESKLGSDHPNTITIMANLGDSYASTGQLNKALPLLEESFARFKAKLGLDHNKTIVCMGYLAYAYEKAGQFDKALPLNNDALLLAKAKLGPDHPETLISMINLARVYRLSRQFDQALPLFEESLALAKTRLGPKNRHTLNTMADLARCYFEAGQKDRGQSLLEETLTLQRASLGPDHPETIVTLTNLANRYVSLNQLAKSIPHFEALLPIQQRSLGRSHPDTQLTVGRLGMCYKMTGRMAAATPLLEEAYQASKEFPSLRKFGVGRQLFELRLATGKKDEAIKLFDELLTDDRKNLPKDSPQLAAQLAHFGLAFAEAQEFTQSEPLFRECLSIREQTEPDVWTTFHTCSLLGGVLVKQMKYDEAEPLLIKGWEGLIAREKDVPKESKSSIRKSLDRVIELYQARNKPDELQKYRELRTRFETDEP